MRRLGSDRHANLIVAKEPARDKLRSRPKTLHPDRPRQRQRSATERHLSFKNSFLHQARPHRLFLHWGQLKQVRHISAALEATIVNWEISVFPASWPYDIQGVGRAAKLYLGQTDDIAGARTAAGAEVAATGSSGGESRQAVWLCRPVLCGECPQS